MVTKFPPKFFRKQVSPWRETYERIRQGPVFPRHTAARNMRSTKKSNTFLYRYSTFLHTTLTTIHGTVSHLNETIKIGHFPFFLSRTDPRSRGTQRFIECRGKKEMHFWWKISNSSDLFSKRKSVLKEKRKETNFRTISSSIIAGNDYLFPPVELKFSPCTELTKTGKIECRYEKYILQRKESRDRQRDPLPLPLPIKALKFSKYR